MMGEKTMREHPEYEDMKCRIIDGFKPAGQRQWTEGDTAMYKYMRIQGRENSRITGYPKGVFSLCWNLIRDKRMTAEDEQLFISIDEWFKENLPEPGPCRNREAVITFFKCGNSDAMIERLKPAVGLLDQYKIPYDVVYTNFAGTIVYEDDWQIAVTVHNGEIV